MLLQKPYNMLSSVGIQKVFLNFYYFFYPLNESQWGPMLFSMLIKLYYYSIILFINI